MIEVFSELQPGVKVTAIYAYAHEQIAFVGGDTLRVDVNLVPRTVCKLNHWSDTVVIAQAGEADFLTELIGKLLPLSGWLGSTDERFFEAFRACHRQYWERAERVYQEKDRGPVPPSIVMVAAAATKTTPARIHKVDFETGEAILTNGRVDADGTNVPQFQADAARHLALLKLGQSDSGLQLDIWARNCVADAAERLPKFIRNQADALIARPSSVHDRIVVQRRMDGPSSTHLDLFAVP